MNILRDSTRAVSFILDPPSVEPDPVDRPPEQGYVVLHDGEHELLAHEHDGQLDAQLHEAAPGRTLLLSPAPEPGEQCECVIITLVE